MVCDVYRKGIEAMAAAGWSEEEIQNLQNEVTLAREKAKADAYSGGLTLRQQEELIARAEREVIKEAHDREHRRAIDGALSIERMAEFRRTHPGEHYGAAEVLKANSIIGSIVSDHG